MFCVSCGKNATIDSLCDGCFTKQRKLFLFENSEMMVCPECGSYYDSEWKPSDSLESSVAEFASSHIVKLGSIRSTKLSSKIVGNTAHVSIEAWGRIPPAKSTKTESAVMQIKIRKRKCDDCVKALGSYYEGVIQVRGINAENILKQIPGGRAERVKNGYDIRFVKKADAKRAAQGLQKKRFSVVDSYKLVAEKKGKKLYRNFYAIR